MGKRVLIHDYAGYPFQIQLGRELARRGHKVLYIYSGYNNTPKGHLEKKETDPENLNVKAIFTREPIQKYSFVKRWFQEIEYGNLLQEDVREFKPDIVLSANTPLDAQRKLIQVCQKQNIKFIFWLQDIIGLAAQRLLRKKIPLLGYWIGWYYIQVEQRMLHTSDHVIVITEDFVQILTDWGVDTTSISVIPNWGPLDEIPVREKVNPWSIRHQLSDKLVFLYAGGLGLKHDPNLLLHLARQFEADDNIRIIVNSEGPGATWLKTMKKELALNNLEIFCYVPFAQVPQVLASGDILLAILEPDSGNFSVPSKVLSYLCAQRPLLLAVPQDNLAAKIVIENEAGLVVSPNSIDDFVQAAIKLVEDRSLREKYASNARKYAEKTFDINQIGTRFEKILLNIGMQHERSDLGN